MRKLLLVATFALASCGGNPVANNAVLSEESGAGEVTAVNDTTAIDAATGEAANMAADVNYTFNEQTTNEVAATNRSTSVKPSRAAKEPVTNTTTASPSPDEPATNNSAEL